jgi:hypothetical protein
MIRQTLHDAITVAGGLATLETCPEVIPPEQFLSALQTIQRTSVHLEEAARRAGVQVGGAVVLTHSPAFSCTVVSVEEGHAILLPLGMIARARVLARLLLRHWGIQSEAGFRFIRSPEDAIDDDPDCFPPVLRPLLLETLSPDEFWPKLLDLDRSVELDPLCETDVGELVHLALVYFMAHEFTHILHGHFELRDRAQAGEVKLGFERLLRGLELDADDGAAAISLMVLNEDISLVREIGLDHSFETGLLRLSYAVAMLFAITDTVRKHFPGYAAGAYNHPMVRCELFFEAAERALPQELIQRWRDVSTQGWAACMKALEMLNYEALSGKFGPLPEGKQWVPIHSLLYGAVPDGPVNRALLDEVRAAAPLLAEVRRLLPIFQRT